MDWFLYDNGFRHERVKHRLHVILKFGFFNAYRVIQILIMNQLVVRSIIMMSVKKTSLARWHEFFVLKRELRKFWWRSNKTKEAHYILSLWLGFFHLFILKKKQFRSGPGKESNLFTTTKLAKWAIKQQKKYAKLVLKH